MIKDKKLKLEDVGLSKEILLKSRWIYRYSYQGLSNGYYSTQIEKVGVKIYRPHLLGVGVKSKSLLIATTERGFKKYSVTILGKEIDDIERAITEEYTKQEVTRNNEKEKISAQVIKDTITKLLVEKNG